MQIKVKNIAPFQNEYNLALKHQYVLRLNTKTGELEATERNGLFPCLKRLFSSYTYKLEEICNYLKDHQHDTVCGLDEQGLRTFRKALKERARHYDATHKDSDLLSTIKGNLPTEGVAESTVIKIQSIYPLQNEFATKIDHILCLDTKTGTLQATPRRGFFAWLARVFSVFTSSTYNLQAICQYLSRHANATVDGLDDDDLRNLKNTLVERAEHHDARHHLGLTALAQQAFANLPEVADETEEEPARIRPIFGDRHDPLGPDPLGGDSGPSIFDHSSYRQRNYDDPFNFSVRPSRPSWSSPVSSGLRAAPGEEVTTDIPEEDLINLRLNLSNGNWSVQNPLVVTFKPDGGSPTPYAAWYTSHDSKFHIQEFKDFNASNQKNKLEAVINAEGQIVSVLEFDDSAPSRVFEVPNKFLDPFKLCITESIKRSSKYESSSGSIRIELLRRGLREAPEYHLEKLSEAILTAMGGNHSTSLRVTFLRDNNEQDQGQDVGGLSRDYLDDLFRGLIAHHELPLHHSQTSALAYPQTQRDYENGKLVPSLTGAEKELYQGIGRVMIFCYYGSTSSNSAVFTGRNFDDSLFRAAFTLNANALNRHFDDIDFEAKLGMCEAFLLARQEAGEDTACYQGWINLLRQNFSTLDDTRLEEAATQAGFAECLSDELWDDDMYTPHMDAVKANREKVKSALADALFSMKTGEYGQLGKMLAPIHAIAQGMKAALDAKNNRTPNNSSWDQTRAGYNYQQFSTKVQGSLDRNAIANSITIEYGVNQEITKKVRWLQDWLRNEATEQDLRDFLKYATGSSCLPQGNQISVASQGTYGDVTPVPKAHTCFSRIDISPIPCQYSNEHHDHTKEGFIKCLKELGFPSSDSYQMA